MSAKTTRKRSPWIALYPDDFLGSIAEMDNEALGLYFRLLLHQATSDSIPDPTTDERAFCRAGGCFPGEWQRPWEQIGHKFEMCEDGRLRNSRMERELAIRNGIRDARIEAGKKGGEANGKQNGSKREANNKQSGSKSTSKTEASTEANTEASTTTSTTTSLSLSSAPAVSSAKADSSSSGDDAEAIKQAFDTFWAAYPRKVGKGQARKSWHRAKREKRLPDLTEVMTALDAATNSEQWQDSHLIPHPTTWINRDGWEDEIAEFKKATQLRGVRPPMVFDPADNIL